MSELDRVRTSVQAIESCLDRSDWDGLAAITFDELEPANNGVDLDSLTEVLRDVEHLQHRIEIAMGALREELDDVPQMRKAARAYVSAP